MRRQYVDAEQLPVSPEDATVEVQTTYVSPEDRYIVSLIVGYSVDDLSDQTRFEDSPKGALAAAIDLTRDEGSPDTIWFVYDRVTGQMHEFEQDDVSDLLGEED